MFDINIAVVAYGCNYLLYFEEHVLFEIQEMKWHVHYMRSELLIIGGVDRWWCRGFWNCGVL